MRVIAFLLILLALLSLVPWFVFAPMIFMTFRDNPTPPVLGVVVAAAVYPAWLLGWLWGIWRALRHDADTMAVIYGIIALLPTIFIGALVAASAERIPLPF